MVAQRPLSDAGLLVTQFDSEVWHHKAWVAGSSPAWLTNRWNHGVMVSQEPAKLSWVFQPSLRSNRSGSAKY